MRKYLIALAACLGVTVAATAPAFAQNCRPLAEAVAFLQADPRTSDVHVANPAEAKLAVEIMNAMPPESDDHFSVVALATATNGAGLLLLGNDGLICVGMPMPAGTWRVFVRSVRGEGA